jgi:hypothetical protein
MYICCRCYIFRPHMVHHQGTLVMGRPLHCTLVLSTYTHFVVVVVVVVVVSYLHTAFQSYLFGGLFTLIW